MPTASVDGRPVFFREAGQGPPALFLHCGLAHSGAFAGLMAALNSRLAMRALDLPGHGGTGYDPSIPVQAQAAANALALIGDGPPAHLIGHSFGATVALRLAVEAPERVASLTLIEPVQYSLLADSGLPAFAAELDEEDALQQAAAAGDWRRAAEVFLSRWGPAGGLAAMTPKQAANAVARMPLVIASERDLVGDAARLRRADLAGVRCPVLLVAGADSPPVVHAIFDTIAGELPAARRLTVPGAGHMVPITHPGPVSEAVAGFLALQDA
jgi:pimeloyl-ACP methyl ester carboxylesterase